MNKFTDILNLQYPLHPASANWVPLKYAWLGGGGHKSSIVSTALLCCIILVLEEVHMAVPPTSPADAGHAKLIKALSSHFGRDPGSLRISSPLSKSHEYLKGDFSAQAAYPVSSLEPSFLSGLPLLSASTQRNLPTPEAECAGVLGLSAPCSGMCWSPCLRLKLQLLVGWFHQSSQPPDGCFVVRISLQGNLPFIFRVCGGGIDVRIPPPHQ
jgi:hypothetical protein